MSVLQAKLDFKKTAKGRGGGGEREVKLTLNK